MDKKFYNQQTDLTASKVKIYKEYITSYLPKILLTYECCLVADLFCGAGKNGKNDGSPLILIEQIKYLLKNKILQRKNPKVDILFNDKEKSNIDKLTKLLKKHSHKNISIKPLQQENFQTILIEILKNNKDNQVPKFFILDPFTYSDVTINNLRDLMALANTEIFLFIPVFHIYRFANVDHQKKHKTRIFLEEFTMKGMAEYKNIDDFMQSIKQKLKQQLNLDYVRPILLDDGKNKNAIFLLTKHIEGMLLMNKIAFKQSGDGKMVNIKEQKSKQNNLFGTPETSRFDIFAKNLEKKLKNKEKITNKEIVGFTIMEEFLPKHAKEALKLIVSNNTITVYDNDSNSNITTKQGKWNIAEKITKNIIFTYDH